MVRQWLKQVWVLLFWRRITGGVFEEALSLSNEVAPTKDETFNDPVYKSGKRVFRTPTWWIEERRGFNLVAYDHNITLDIYTTSPEMHVFRAVYNIGSLTIPVFHDGDWRGMLHRAYGRQQQEKELSAWLAQQPIHAFRNEDE
jgi:hypothetical protein